MNRKQLFFHNMNDCNTKSSVCIIGSNKGGGGNILVGHGGDKN